VADHRSVIGHGAFFYSAETAGVQFLDRPRRREAAGGHYQPLAEWALGSGESVVSFLRFIIELLTLPPRLTRAAGLLLKHAVLFPRQTTAKM
jgi:hypothetical protein